MLNILHSNGYIHKVFGNETGLRTVRPEKYCALLNHLPEGILIKAWLMELQDNDLKGYFHRQYLYVIVAAILAASASAILQRFNGDLIAILSRLLKSLYEVKIKRAKILLGSLKASLILSLHTLC